MPPIITEMILTYIIRYGEFAAYHVPDTLPGGIVSARTVAALSSRANANAITDIG